jgi:predicted transcriptional regulator
MNIYIGVEEVASFLGLSPSTIKKYYLLIEEKGYRFKRSQQGRVMFGNKEIEMFKNLIYYKNERGMSVQKAVEKVMSDITDITVYKEPKDQSQTVDMAVITNMSNIQKETRDLLIKQHNIILNLQNQINEIREEQKKRVKMIESESSKSDQFFSKSDEKIEELKKILEDIRRSQKKKKWWEIWK